MVDNPLSDGLWRTVDILIGIVLALAFPSPLPLYAVVAASSLASALRDCAAIYSRIINGQSVTDDEHASAAQPFERGHRAVRSLMPSVSKCEFPLTELDYAQAPPAHVSAPWRFSAIPGRTRVTSRRWRACR